MHWHMQWGILQPTGSIGSNLCGEIHRNKNVAIKKHGPSQPFHRSLSTPTEPRVKSSTDLEKLRKCILIVLCSSLSKETSEAERGPASA